LIIQDKCGVKTKLQLITAVNSVKPIKEMSV